MNKIEWKYVIPLTDIDSVDYFLLKNGMKLPQEIIDCIKQNNAGRPKPNVFDTAEKKERVFKSLLSYNDNDRENIYSIYPGDFKTLGLYPIASDPAGNFICCDCKNNGQIVFLNMETNHKEFISKNFNELINSLYDVKNGTAQEYKKASA